MVSETRRPKTAIINPVSRKPFISRKTLQISMTDTSLEIECRSCGNLYWYSGSKSNPETAECPECGTLNIIPEDG